MRDHTFRPPLQFSETDDAKGESAQRFPHRNGTQRVKNLSPHLGSCHCYRRMTPLCSRLLLRRQHHQSVLPGSLFRVCTPLGYSSVTASPKCMAFPTAEEGDPAAHPTLSCTHVSQACRAPRWHLLATTCALACSLLTLPTDPSL